MAKIITLMLAIMITLFSCQAFAEDPPSMTFKSSSTYFKVFKKPSTSWNPYGDGVALNCDTYSLDSAIGGLNPQYDPLLSASALCGSFDYGEIDTYAVYNYDSSPGDEFETNLDGTPRQFFRVQIYCQREDGERRMPEQVILHCVDHKALEIEKTQKQP